MTTFSPSISIHVSPKPAAPPAPPPGVFAFVLHDWQMEQFKYKPRSLFSPTDSLGDDKGYPEMCPFNPRIGVKLTERLQWWWFGQLQLSLSAGFAQAGAPGMSIAELKNAWRGLTKGFTAFMNHKGTDEYHDYINRQNEGADLPQLFENTCGGTTVELFNKSIYAKGYKVKTLKTSDYELWKDWNFRTHPQYFTKATNATVIPYGGKWRVDPMHYLDGADVPVPIISEAGHVFIDPARVRVLDDGELFPREYYP